jgi:hypothetical protein
MEETSGTFLRGRIVRGALELALHRAHPRRQPWLVLFAVTWMTIIVALAVDMFVRNRMRRDFDGNVSPSQ